MRDSNANSGSKKTSSNDSNNNVKQTGNATNYTGNVNNPLQEKELDVLDPEAKAKAQNEEKKSFKDRINDGKDTVNKGKKAVEVISKIPPPVLIAILIIIILVGVIGFFTSIPGLLVGQIKEFAKNMWDGIQSLFTTEANAYVNDEDVIDLANYLEEMDYNLVGYGFVEIDLDEISTYLDYTEVLEDYPYYEQRDGDSNYRYYNEDGQAYGEGEGESGYYYNSLGVLIDNSTGEKCVTDTIDEDSVYEDKYGIYRSTTETNISGAGVIREMSGVDTTLLRSYLLSDYRINTLRNDDEDVLTYIYSRIKSIFGGYDSAWSKGLIKLYLAKDGLATNVYGKNLFDSIFGTSWFDTIEIDADSSTMIISSGFFNNDMSYFIDGWADRYGMNLEFLLSLHLATMAPDLVYAMLQSFDTEVQVYLNDSGEASVESKYVEISDSDATIEDDGINLSDIKKALLAGGFDTAAYMLNDVTTMLDGSFINRTNAQYLLTCDELNLESPPNCTGQAQEYLIEKSTYQTNSFLWLDTSTNPLANYGIDSTVDSEVYDEFDSYENYTTAEEIEFDPEHVAQAIGVDNASYETDDTYTWFSASDYGYDEDTAESEITVDEEFATTEMSKTNDSYSTGTEYSGSTITSSTKYFYTIKRVKQYITWEAEVDGEEVSYEWVIYKYLIYETGKQDITTTTTWTVLSSDETTKEGEIETYDTPEWVNTIMVEYIVREKTVDELIDAGIITYDEETDSYIYRGVEATKCSNNEEGIKCCENCKKYVTKVIQALANVSDSDYNTSIPYIARVLGSWFRDTYFIIPEEEDFAIEDYINETDRSSAEKYMIANSYGENSTLVVVDEDYLGETGEYWTDYEMKSEDEDEYQLYYLNPDGTTSDTTMEDFLDDNGYTNNGTIKYDEAQAVAEADGHAFVKKAITKTVTEVEAESAERSVGAAESLDDVLWSAYEFDSSGSSGSWVHIAQDDTSVSDNTYIETVYSMFEEDWENEEGGFYYKLNQTNSIIQVEDAQRSETNATVKWLFKYRKYYIYDGTESRAMSIAEDKEVVLTWVESYLKTKYANWAPLIPSHVASLLGQYGRSALRQTYSIVTFDSWSEDLLEQWLDWQLDMYYSGITNGCPSSDIVITDDLYFKEETDDDGNVTGLTVVTSESEADRIGDPRNPNLIDTVKIDKSSLEAFSILENTQTYAAEYAYRDFKELIVELNYFDKEDLSDKIESVFTWVIPDISNIGWPYRPYDKQTVDYGALIESAATYDFLEEIEYSSEETSSGFKGYQGGEYVVSPVTGKVLEYDTHERTNVYTGETEEVGYILIQVLDADGASAVSDYSSFYDEYEDVCDGYIVMIDGFDVDLDLSGGEYAQNEVYALYNTDEQARLEEIEQEKDDAPFRVDVNGDIYIKEGKYIGTTYADSEDNQWTTSDGETGYANYIRIIVKDTDYTVIDDVEDFFNIEEVEFISSTSDGSSSSSSDVSYTTYDGSTVAEKVWNALIDAGYSEIAAAGAMGNIHCESGFATNNLEDSKNIGYTDESYTAAVDSGEYSEDSFVNDWCRLWVAPVDLPFEEANTVQCCSVCRKRCKYK